MIGSRSRFLTRIAAPVLALMLLLVGCSRGADAPEKTTERAAPSGKGVVTVDLIYLDHRPSRNVVAQVDELLAKYGDGIRVNRYSFDSPEGKEFARSKKLTEHTPLAIFLNGSMETSVNGRKVRFYSFPQGKGTGMTDAGDWSLADLEAAIGALVGEAK